MVHMLLNTIEPYRYNYFKKRIEITSEVLPILKNSYLADIKNVKLILMYVNEPVLYVYDEKARIIYSDVVEQVEVPSRRGKLSEVFEYFITSLFYDLLVGEFNNKVVCMTRANENDVNLSVLISDLEYEDANKVLKNPSLLVQKYVFENTDIEAELQTKDVKKKEVDKNEVYDNDENINYTESRTMNEKEESFDESDSCVNKENMNCLESKENYSNVANKSEVERQITEQNEEVSIHDVKEEYETDNEVNGCHTIEMRVSDDNKRDKDTRSAFRKVKDKLRSWLKKEKEDRKVEWEGDPGYLIVGSKNEHRITIIKKIKLAKCFSLDTKKDLEMLDDLITNEHFYAEIQSRVRVFIVKEDKISIFINTNVTLDQERFLENVEKLGKKMEKIREKGSCEVKSAHD